MWQAVQVGGRVVLALATLVLVLVVLVLAVLVGLVQVVQEMLHPGTE